MAKRIFISYRREDSIDATGRLYEHLEPEFPDAIFMDVEGGIRAGKDFVEVLNTQVAQCDIFLAVIGRSWLTATDELGRRRIDNEGDFVRVEIAAALENGKIVIPVLVSGAEIPRADELPRILQSLGRRHAVRLNSERFRSDVQGLIREIKHSLAETEEARRSASEAERLAQERAEQEARQQAAQAARQRAEEETRAQEGMQTNESPQRRAPPPSLSAIDIRKAEELANWEFVKARAEAHELRDHLARYPSGITQRMARARLEEIVWETLGSAPDKRLIEGFLGEFPTGKYSEQAKKRIDVLRQIDVMQQEEASRERRVDHWSESERPTFGPGGNYKLPPVGFVLVMFNLFIFFGISLDRPIWQLRLPSGALWFFSIHDLLLASVFCSISFKVLQASYSLSQTLIPAILVLLICLTELLFVPQAQVGTFVFITIGAALELAAGCIVEIRTARRDLYIGLDLK